MKKKYKNKRKKIKATKAAVAVTSLLLMSSFSVPIALEISKDNYKDKKNIHFKNKVFKNEKEVVNYVKENVQKIKWDNSLEGQKKLYTVNVEGVDKTFTSINDAIEYISSRVSSKLVYLKDDAYFNPMNHEIDPSQFIERGHGQKYIIFKKYNPNWVSANVSKTSISDNSTFTFAKVGDSEAQTRALYEAARSYVQVHKAYYFDGIYFEDKLQIRNYLSMLKSNKDHFSKIIENEYGRQNLVYIKLPNNSLVFINIGKSSGEDFYNKLKDKNSLFYKEFKRKIGRNSSPYFKYKDRKTNKWAYIEINQRNREIIKEHLEESDSEINFIKIESNGDKTTDIVDMDRTTPNGNIYGSYEVNSALSMSSVNDPSEWVVSYSGPSHTKWEGVKSEFNVTLKTTLIQEVFNYILFMSGNPNPLSLLAAVINESAGKNETLLHYLLVLDKKNKREKNINTNYFNKIFQLFQKLSQGERYNPLDSIIISYQAIINMMIKNKEDNSKIIDVAKFYDNILFVLDGFLSSFLAPIFLPEQSEDETKMQNFHINYLQSAFKIFGDGNMRQISFQKNLYSFYRKLSGNLGVAADNNEEKLHRTVYNIMIAMLGVEDISIGKIDKYNGVIQKIYNHPESLFTEEEYESLLKNRSYSADLIKNKMVKKLNGIQKFSKIKNINSNIRKQVSGEEWEIVFSNLFGKNTNDEFKLQDTLIGEKNFSPNLIRKNFTEFLESGKNNQFSLVSKKAIEYFVEFYREHFKIFSNTNGSQSDLDKWDKYKRENKPDILEKGFNPALNSGEYHRRLSRLQEQSVIPINFRIAQFASDFTQFAKNGYYLSHGAKSHWSRSMDIMKKRRESKKNKNNERNKDDHSDSSSKKGDYKTFEGKVVEEEQERIHARENDGEQVQPLLDQQARQSLEESQLNLGHSDTVDALIHASNDDNISMSSDGSFFSATSEVYSSKDEGETNHNEANGADAAIQTFHIQETELKKNEELLRSQRTEVVSTYSELGRILEGLEHEEKILNGNLNFNNHYFSGSLSEKTFSEIREIKKIINEDENKLVQTLIESLGNEGSSTNFTIPSSYSNELINYAGKILSELKTNENIPRDHFIKEDSFDTKSFLNALLNDDETNIMVATKKVFLSSLRLSEGQSSDNLSISEKAKIMRDNLESSWKNNVTNFRENPLDNNSEIIKRYTKSHSEVEEINNKLHETIASQSMLKVFENNAKLNIKPLPTNQHKELHEANIKESRFNELETAIEDRIIDNTKRLDEINEEVAQFLSTYDYDEENMIKTLAANQKISQDLLGDNESLEALLTNINEHKKNIDLIKNGKFVFNEEGFVNGKIFNNNSKIDKLNKDKQEQNEQNEVIKNKKDHWESKFVDVSEEESKFKIQKKEDIEKISSFKEKYNNEDSALFSSFDSDNFNEQMALEKLNGFLKELKAEHTNNDDLKRWKETMKNVLMDANETIYFKHPWKNNFGINNLLDSFKKRDSIFNKLFLDLISKNNYEIPSKSEFISRLNEVHDYYGGADNFYKFRIGIYRFASSFFKNEDDKSFDISLKNTINNQKFNSKSFEEQNRKTRSIIKKFDDELEANNTKIKQIEAEIEQTSKDSLNFKKAIEETLPKQYITEFERKKADLEEEYRWKLTKKDELEKQISTNKDLMEQIKNRSLENDHKIKKLREEHNAISKDVLKNNNANFLKAWLNIFEKMFSEEIEDVGIKNDAEAILSSIRNIKVWASENREKFRNQEFLDNKENFDSSKNEFNKLLNDYIDEFDRFARRNDSFVENNDHIIEGKNKVEDLSREISRSWINLEMFSDENLSDSFRETGANIEDIIRHLKEERVITKDAEFIYDDDDETYTMPKGKFDTNSSYIKRYKRKAIFKALAETEERTRKDHNELYSDYSSPEDIGLHEVTQGTVDDLSTLRKQIYDSSEESGNGNFDLNHEFSNSITSGQLSERALSSIESVKDSEEYNNIVRDFKKSGLTNGFRKFISNLGGFTSAFKEYEVFEVLFIINNLNMYRERFEYDDYIDGGKDVKYYIDLDYVIWKLEKQIKNDVNDDAAKNVENEINDTIKNKLQFYAESVGENGIQNNEEVEDISDKLFDSAEGDITGMSIYNAFSRGEDSSSVTPLLASILVDLIPQSPLNNIISFFFRKSYNRSTVYRYSQQELGTSLYWDGGQTHYENWGLDEEVVYDIRDLRMIWIPEIISGYSGSEAGYYIDGKIYQDLNILKGEVVDKMIKDAYDLSLHFNEEIANKYSWGIRGIKKNSSNSFKIYDKFQDILEDYAYKVSSNIFSKKAFSTTEGTYSLNKISDSVIEQIVSRVKPIVILFTFENITRGMGDFKLPYPRWDRQKSSVLHAYDDEVVKKNSYLLEPITGLNMTTFIDRVNLVENEDVENLNKRINLTKRYEIIYSNISNGNLSQSLNASQGLKTNVAKDLKYYYDNYRYNEVEERLNDVVNQYIDKYSLLSQIQSSSKVVIFNELFDNKSYFDDFENDWRDKQLSKIFYFDIPVNKKDFVIGRTTKYFSSFTNAFKAAINKNNYDLIEKDYSSNRTFVLLFSGLEFNNLNEIINYVITNRGGTQ